MAEIDRVSRHNITLHVLDGTLFMSGMVFFETSTIMVAYIKQIYDNAFVIGAIPALLMIGWNLPGIFSAKYAERFERRKTFIRFFAFFQRFALLGLSLSTYIIGMFSPSMNAAVILLVFCLFPIFGGIATPAWLDFVGKTVPISYRARTHALRNFLASIGGVLFPILIGRIFLAYDFPGNYRISFFIGFLFVFASLIAFLGIKEEKDSPVPHQRSLAAYFRTTWTLVRGNRNFLRFLLARTLQSGAACGGAFYTAYSIDHFGSVDESLIVTYTFALYAGKAGSSLLFGILGDKIGNLVVQEIGTLTTALTLIIAALFPNPVTFIVIFVLFAVSTSADLNGSQVLITEFGDDSDRMYYSAVFTTVVGTVGGIVPLIGGLLLALGFVDYGTLFLASAIFAFAGSIVYFFTVKDPRHTRRAVA